MPPTKKKVVVKKKKEEEENVSLSRSPSPVPAKKAKKKVELKPCPPGKIRNENNRCINDPALKATKPKASKPSPEEPKPPKAAKELKPCPPGKIRNANNRCVNDPALKATKKLTVAPALKPIKNADVDVSAYTDVDMTADQLKATIQASMTTTFDIDVKPKAWPMPSRASFGPWLDKTFKYRDGKRKDSDGSAFHLFPHQKFIKDYIQFDSPYRGMLVFHGLGVGKSASSIAAAEMLLNHMDVLVMIPASLKDNYVNEVRKYGRAFFQTQQHWVFVPLDNFEDDLAAVAGLLRMSAENIRRQKGIWVPVIGKPANFGSLPGPVQAQIAAQIDNIIRTRFQYINYNGLTRKAVDELAGNGKNPFNNKCIIIDEIHNLISRISNQRQIGRAIYRLLMKAENCKIIMLSGTPIINYPHEVAYLINLITGHRRVYEVKAAKDTLLKYDEVAGALKAHPHVDSFQVDPNGRRVTFTMLPAGFVNRPGGMVARESDKTKKIATPAEVVKALTAAGVPVQTAVVTKDYETLPTDEEDFNKFFIDFNRNEVQNPILFMRRILGTVSFYSTYNPELYPQVTTTEVPLTMNEFMFGFYEKYRKEEIKQEMRSSGKKGAAPGGGNLFHNSSQVYRFYSRALCNFVFPKEVVRPFPSGMSMMKKEMDLVDDDGEELNEAMAVPDAKAAAKAAYPALLEEALVKLEEGEYLAQDKELLKFSPKFHSILHSIDNSPGSVLIYSQFRKVEGLGILAMAMRARGWAPFQIQKIDGEWMLAIPEEDMAKPKYVMFTGSDEETRVMLKIFNSETESIPPKIREALGGANNHKGELIKAMMITQSGAEGISLKNVRQVHVLEPYWNHIRIDQVVGRAVRAFSHMDLAPEDRNVQVFIYYMQLSEKQKENITMKRKDRGLSTDEYIYNLAKNKAKIVNGFLDLMKRASIDCALNAKQHGNLKCFAFPTNIKNDQVVSAHDIRDEELDTQYSAKIKKLTWPAKAVITANGNYLIRKDTGDVYDYDVYVESGKLVKVGVLQEGPQGQPMKIKMLQHSD